MVNKKLRQWAAREKETSLPPIVKERMDQTLASLPEKHHRFSMRRAAWSGAAAVALLIGGTIAAGFVSPTMAQALKRIPLIGTVFETVGDYGLKTRYIQGDRSVI
jgi:hypothetical protein